MAVRRKTIKREVGPALRAVLEPGDQIVAETWATTGPGPWLDVVGAILVMASEFAGFKIGTAALWGGFTAICVPLTMMIMRRPVFVAVTERELICYRLSRGTNDPDRLWFRAPLLTVRVTSLGPVVFSRWRSIRYDGPGVDGRGLRLNVYGRWRRDLDERTSGAARPGRQRGGPAAHQSASQRPRRLKDACDEIGPSGLSALASPDLMRRPRMRRLLGENPC